MPSMPSMPSSQEPRSCWGRGGQEAGACLPQGGSRSWEGLVGDTQLRFPNCKAGVPRDSVYSSVHVTDNLPSGRTRLCSGHGVY